MAITTDATKRLGYGGSAEVDGEQVLITSGGFTRDTSLSYLEPFSIPAGTGYPRSRVKHADGVRAFSGDLSLDVTDSFLDVLTASKLLSRAYSFDVGIHDGEDAEVMTDVYLTTLSLQGAPGGIITASMSFTGVKAPSSSTSVLNAFVRDVDPYGYWYSGNTDVKEWTFTFNQDAQPVYVNQGDTAPRYIKIGLVDYSLDVTTFNAVQTHSVINIATRTFTITGNTASQGFQYQGQTEIGQYSHSFETSADIDTGSQAVIIT